MKPYYADEDVTLYLGDCLDVLRTLEADSIDAIVTDPPAGIAFMGRDWDDFRRARWRFTEWLTERMSEALRVLKPGGHLLVWSLPRTSHWTAWALEDAGLEIRDCILHLFGSGFPKSLDVSKAIDKRRDDSAAVHCVTAFVAAARARAGLANRDIDAAFGINGMAGHWTNTRGPQAAVPTWEQWQQLRALIGFGDEMDAEVWRLNGRKGEPGEAWEQREVIGHWDSPGRGSRSAEQKYGLVSDSGDITAPATEDAARWAGFGTALKPGQEMWWLARKPLKGTVAAGVLEFGTGALNIDGCKVAHASEADLAKSRASNRHADWGSGPRENNILGDMSQHTRADQGNYDGSAGRWPANVVFTHSAACDGVCALDCPAGELDRQSGVTASRKGVRPPSYGATSGVHEGWRRPAHADYHDKPDAGFDDTGGASRFYPVFRYQAKAPASERPRLDDGTAHETVKPLGLMTWLVRLVTPPGGTVLDLFAGSGPVAEACIIEGFRCVLIEQDPKSARLIVRRLSKPIQPAMFGDAL